VDFSRAWLGIERIRYASAEKQNIPVRASNRALLTHLNPVAISKSTKLIAIKVSVIFSDASSATARYSNVGISSMSVCSISWAGYG
jgi:hypothetical protein